MRKMMYYDREANVFLYCTTIDEIPLHRAAFELKYNLIFQDIMLSDMDAARYW